MVRPRLPVLPWPGVAAAAFCPARMWSSGIGKTCLRLGFGHLPHRVPLLLAMVAAGWTQAWVPACHRTQLGSKWIRHRIALAGIRAVPPAERLRVAGRRAATEAS